MIRSACCLAALGILLALLAREAGPGIYHVVNTGSAISEPKKYFGDGFGIAMKKRDRDLKKAIDGALEALKADGTLKRLNDKYFASAATASDNHQ